MTPRRVVALAQASAMILLLLPGPLPAGPSPVHAAPRPAEPDQATVFDATGKGIGCRPGGKRFKGPGLAVDPPWPPGAEPTPAPTLTPAPTTSPEPGSSAPPVTEPAPGASAEPAPTPTPEPESEAAVMAFVAANGTRPVQAAAPTPRPRSKLITGIDVSRHQGDVDFEKVREAGHRFVFIKATQDIDWIDPLHVTHTTQARAAGLSTASYHFFDYTLDGRAQADHFIDQVEAAGALERALPLVVDVECFAPIGAPSIHAVAAARLRDLVDRVYERTGRLPMIYTSVHMWREVVGNAAGFEDLPLWAACWGCGLPPRIAPGWSEWSFWQEGLTRVPGVGRVDGNYFSGSGKELKALQLRPFSIDGGAVATDGGTVELDLGNRDATHIRTSPDGQTWSAWSPIRSTPTAAIPNSEGEHTVFAQLRLGPGLESPVVSDSIVVDTTPPQLSVPTLSLRTGLLGPDAATIPVTVSWEARDETAGLADASVSVSCDRGGPTEVEAPGHAEPGELAAWDAPASLFADAECSVTAIGVDGAGNREPMTVDGVTTRLLDPEGDGLRATVEADQVGIVATRGPSKGRAAVLVDGDAVALIDLYAPEASGPEIVHLVDLSDGPHTVGLEPTGSSDPASTGTEVAVTSFAALSR